MQTKYLKDDQKALIRNVYNEFKLQLNTLYPKTKMYSYYELMKWYDEHLPKYFDEVAKQYNLDVKVKFNLLERKMIVYTPNLNIKLMTIRLNIGGRLKQANNHNYHIDHGFIFDKKE